MDRYPLEQLLDLRKRREDDASKQLQIARQALETAENELKEARSTPSRFQQERIEQENSLYASVLGKSVKKMAIDDLFSQIGDLAAHEAELQTKVLAAEENVEKKKEDVATSQQRYRDAFRDREKIAEHRRQWLVQALLEEERVMDKELEEFRVNASDSLTAN